MITPMDKTARIRDTIIRVLGRGLPELTFSVTQPFDGRYKIVAFGLNNQIKIVQTANLKHRILHGEEAFLPIFLRGQGLARQIVLNCVSLCRELNLETIEINATNDGRYAWAKMGFQPDPQDWERIKKRLKIIINENRDLANSRDSQLAVQIIESDDPFALFLLARLKEVVSGNAEHQDEKATFGKLLLTTLDSWRGSFDIANQRSLEILLGEKNE